MAPRRKLAEASRQKHRLESCFDDLVLTDIEMHRTDIDV